MFDGGYPIDKNGASTTMASSSTDTTDPSATSTKKQIEVVIVPVWCSLIFQAEG